MARSRTCRSKHIIHHDLLQPCDRFVDGLGNEDTFPGGESIGFQNHLETTSLDVVHSLLVFRGGEDAEFGGRNMMAIHESF